MAVQTETLQVTGIRCERCVGRLAATLKDQPGLEQANANLMGQVTLSWDDEQTSATTSSRRWRAAASAPAERSSTVRSSTPALSGVGRFPHAAGIPAGYRRRFPLARVAG